MSRVAKRRFDAAAWQRVVDAARREGFKIDEQTVHEEAKGVPRVRVSFFQAIYYDPDDGPPDKPPAVHLRDVRGGT